MERRVTLPKEVEKQYDHSGVVAFIFDSKGRILVTREREDKETAFERGTPKKPDQLGVITETREPDEIWQTTIIRSFKEELGLDPKEVFGKGLLQVTNNTYIGETLFREGVLATVTQWYCPDTEALLKNVKPNPDLDVLGFFQIDMFEKSGNIRHGVKRVLDEYMDLDISFVPNNSK